MAIIRSPTGDDRVVVLRARSRFCTFVHQERRVEPMVMFSACLSWCRMLCSGPSCIAFPLSHPAKPRQLTTHPCQTPLTRDPCLQALPLDQALLVSPSSEAAALIEAAEREEQVVIEVMVRQRGGEGEAVQSIAARLTLISLSQCERSCLGRLEFQTPTMGPGELE
jgi:hypothetical protein